MDGSSEEVLLVVDAVEASPPLLYLRGGGGETGTNFLCDLCTAEFSLAASPGGLWLHRLEGREASVTGVWL